MFDAFDPDAPLTMDSPIAITATIDQPPIEDPKPPIAIIAIGGESATREYQNTRNRPTPDRVPFLSDVITARADDGKVWVLFKELCDHLGLDYASQYSKIRKPGEYEVRKITLWLGSDRSARSCLMLSGKSMLKWLMSINPGKVAPEKRPKLQLFQTEALDHLERHFFGDRRPVRVEPRPTRAEPAVAQPAGDDPITGILNTMLRIRECQLADQRRLDDIEADVRGVRDRIGDIEGAVNDATRRLLSVEAKVADPIALKPAPEPWMTVGEFCRTAGLNLTDNERFEAGGGLHDLMAERGLKIKRKASRHGYSQNTYPLPVLKDYFRGE